MILAWPVRLVVGTGADAPTPKLNAFAITPLIGHARCPVRCCARSRPVADIGG